MVAKRYKKKIQAIINITNVLHWVDVLIAVYASLHWKSLSLSPMPGTIVVSVLEFKSIQSSSAPLQLCIKVSMGKKEYQTWDKEEFSFPLATLRDNLVIQLLDAQGNLVSQTAIQPRLVVEKGVWDDVFLLEGGSQVHLKLQFVLSEDERHRIHIMRETALRKKHGELLSGSLTSPGNANVVRHSHSESSLCLNKEVSERSIPQDSQKSLPQGEEIAMKAGVTTKKIEEASFPIDAKRLQQPSILQELNVDQARSSHGGSSDKEKLISQELNVDQAKSSHGDSSEKEKLLASKTEKDGPVNVNKKHQVGKTPRNVKNMISAFESGTTQDTGSRMKPPPAKIQLNKFETENPLRNSSLNEAKTEKLKLAESVVTMVKKPSLAKESQHASVCTKEMKSQDNADVKNKIIRKEVNDVKEMKISSDNVTRATTGKAATFSGRRPDGHILLEEIKSNGKSTVKEIEGIDRKNLPKVENKGVMCDDMKAEEKWEDKHNSSDCPGTWIFPVESGRICITTASKETIELMENCHSEAEADGRKDSSAPEKAEKCRVARGVNMKAKREGKNIGQKPRKPKVENSADNENSKRPIGQAMRVAMMIGFAVFVFFTRERKNR